MDVSVLDRLSEKEKEAQDLLSRMTEKKAALQKEADEQIAGFDKKTDERVEKRVASIRADVEDTLMQQLRRQQEMNERVLADMEERFEKEADRRADEIVRRVLR